MKLGKAQRPTLQAEPFLMVYILCTEKIKQKEMKEALLAWCQRSYSVSLSKSLLQSSLGSRDDPGREITRLYAKLLLWKSLKENEIRQEEINSNLPRLRSKSEQNSICS